MKHNRSDEEDYYYEREYAKKVLRYLERETVTTNIGVCTVLHIMDAPIDVFWRDILEYNLPKFYRMEERYRTTPKDTGLWFKNNLERIKAIKDCYNI